VDSPPPSWAESLTIRHIDNELISRRSWSSIVAGWTKATLSTYLSYVQVSNKNVALSMREINGVVLGGSVVVNCKFDNSDRWSLYFTTSGWDLA